MWLKMKLTDFLIAGAGIVGLSIARELAKRYPDAKITIADKEKQEAFHASGRNSGVLHAGFYYDSDSLKAKFTVSGNKALTAYCLENDLPINRCGKVVVASNESEINGIYELKNRGDKNGVALSLIDEKELADIEPNARTCEKALFSPTTSSVNPRMVCRHIANGFPKNVRLLFDTEIRKFKKNQALTDSGKIGYGHFFNAAGLYADKIAHLFGLGKNYTVLPFKGIYLAHTDNSLLQRHVYPVPNLKNPFLGVHFTKTVDNHVKIGPTAIPAFWRENYTFSERFRLGEFMQISACQLGLLAENTFNFRDLAINEMRKYNRRHFIGESVKLVKKIDTRKFGNYLPPGIRAQLFDLSERKLVMDFLIERTENTTHVLNAVSPAFTTAFSFAEHVVDIALGADS